MYTDEQTQTVAAEEKTEHYALASLQLTLHLAVHSYLAAYDPARSDTLPDIRNPRTLASIRGAKSGVHSVGVHVGIDAFLCIADAYSAFSKFTYNPHEFLTRSLERSSQFGENVHYEFAAELENSKGLGFDPENLTSKVLFSKPIWSKRNDDFLGDASEFRPLSEGPSQRTPWAFWQEWYRGYLHGKPLDWELQRRVALISDAVWEGGPEAVAAEIERIRSRYELEQEVASLKDQLAAVKRAPLAALIGDNGGPPLEDAPARALQTDLALIWKQVEELEEEIAKPSPSPSLLEKIAKTLWEISLRIAAYCGSVADGMVREGSKELAKAGAKWAAGATAVTITAQTEGVQSVAKAIWALVKALQ